MKIVICFLIILFSYIVGKIILRSYKEEELTLKEILNFIDYMKIEINFSKKKKTELIDDYLKNCKTSLKKVINDKNLCILHKNKQQELENMLNNIGTTDLEGQNVMLEKYALIFKSYYEDACLKYKNLSSYIIKLAVCLGLVVCILIL